MTTPAFAAMSPCGAQSRSEATGIRKASLLQVAQAFGFDGTRGFIQVPSAASLDPTQSATLEGWVYFDKLPSVAGHHMSILAKSASGNNFDLQAETDNRFRFYLANAVVASTTVIQTGSWYHVAGTYAAKSSLELYVNGSLEAVTPFGSTRTANGRGGTDPSAVLTWGNPALPAEAFSLQASINVAGPYVAIAGATSPYTNAALNRQMFFRLKAN